MRKTGKIGIRVVPFHLLFLITTFTAMAQKLPNKQSISLRAPNDIKIDGRATEWNNKLEAYNNATNLFYTISNDDENLYLIIQTNYIDALTKILKTGIILAINTTGKKSDVNAISITYPVFTDNNKPVINFKAWPKIIQDLPSGLQKADSVMKESNNRLNTKSKYIKIIGIAGIDSMSSVYNENGIKTSEAFDNQMNYTYELAIPLKYLSLNVKKSLMFSYHIILPGTTLSDYGVKEEVGSGGMISFSAPGGTQFPSKNHLAATTSTTDFWGEYILAK